MRRAAAAIAAFAVANAGAGVAHADGDPASDVLLGSDVFYPYSPPVSSALQSKLEALTAQAKREGFPIKVALIASPVDLGVIPDLFNRPQPYAKFLDQEISYQHYQPLLVVMPAGFGVQGVPGGAAAIAKVSKPSGKASDDLATAAIAALPALAKASGHALSAATGTSGSSGGGGTGAGSGGGGSSSDLLIGVLGGGALLVAIALATLNVRGRRRARDAAQDGLSATRADSPND